MSLLALSLPAVFTAVFDPFFFLHKRFAEHGFDGTDRYQNAGLIKSYLADPAENFNSVIIGTSVSQNFTASHFDQPDGKTLKLTLAGAKPRDLAVIAQSAIDTGRVKNIYWEVFTPYAEGTADDQHDIAPPPAFLYNKTAADNWRYFFNNDVFEEALKIARGKPGKRKKLDDLYKWENTEQFEKFSSPENKNALRTQLQKATSIKNAADFIDAFPNITENILPRVQKNPGINFNFFFPPASCFSYANMGDEGFGRLMAMRENLIKHMDKIKNVTIYGFDLENFPCDLRNYMDPIHYKPAYNDLMAQRIRQGENKITLQSWPRYKSALTQKVQSFRKSFLQ